jgi:hypothetical protein
VVVMVVLLLLLLQQEAVQRPMVGQLWQTFLFPGAW